MGILLRKRNNFIGKSFNFCFPMTISLIVKSENLVYCILKEQGDKFRILFK